VTSEGAVGRRSYAGTAAELAGHVLGALAEGGPVRISAFFDSCADVVAGLGAVRLVGADVFASHVLPGHPLEARDAGVVADAFGAFPPVYQPVTQEQRVMAWRDWAMVRLLTRLTGERSATPAPAELWQDWGVTRPVPARVARTPGEPADVLGPPEDWRRWSVVVAQLSALALPGVGGPVVEAVAREPLALGRGVTRAVLRRDHATAARLARWVALVGDRVPVDPVPLLEHLRLHAGADARLLLDLAVARHLVERR